MSLLRVTFFAVVVSGCVSSAFAFQEQRQGAPAAPSAPAADSRAVDFSAPSTDAAKTGGTEVRIPGLGKLGNLPRMDFGLELLYGVSDGKQQSQPVPSQREDQRDDDLTIRGTVRHKF